MTMQQGAKLNPWVQEKLNEIASHSAWHAELTGIEAEALLRLKPSFTYLIRQGEKVDHFYLSFIKGEEFCHLPFTIDYSSLQWFYRNMYPHFARDLEIFIPEIMHRDVAECHPLMQFAQKG
ncbi:MAG TPA: hypothetical protein VFU89_04645 [Rhabdochlamydiaceae bacterium]|nr:hypothetical protein [Rhabdochlamydiaceae bacterium]